MATCATSPQHLHNIDDARTTMDNIDPSPSSKARTSPPSSRQYRPTAASSTNHNSQLFTANPQFQPLGKQLQETTRNNGNSRVETRCPFVAWTVSAKLSIPKLVVPTILQSFWGIRYTKW
ncbi:hypothetical protein ACRALDRAFT_213308 [Sodiomyces alcalophilus JCM 7366]|uniref:uncharacterized protein n=1 Tax=Sodiomyces alcalophilus JCM 7366 TaxID=591952 RepID=UPI0039B539E7